MDHNAYTGATGLAPLSVNIIAVYHSFKTCVTSKASVTVIKVGIVVETKLHIDTANGTLLVLGASKF